MDKERKKLFAGVAKIRNRKINQPRLRRTCAGLQDDLLLRSTMSFEAYLDIPTYLRRGVELPY